MGGGGDENEPDLGMSPLLSFLYQGCLHDAYGNVETLNWGVNNP